jgi:hypothetical protein
MFTSIRIGPNTTVTPNIHFTNFVVRPNEGPVWQLKMEHNRYTRPDPLALRCSLNAESLAPSWAREDHLPSLFHLLDSIRDEIALKRAAVCYLLQRVLMWCVHTTPRCSMDETFQQTDNETTPTAPYRHERGNDLCAATRLSGTHPARFDAVNSSGVGSI